MKYRKKIVAKCLLGFCQKESKSEKKKKKILYYCIEGQFQLPKTITPIFYFVELDGSAPLDTQTQLHFHPKFI